MMGNCQVLFLGEGDTATCASLPAKVTKESAGASLGIGTAPCLTLKQQFKLVSNSNFLVKSSNSASCRSFAVLEMEKN